MTFTHHLKHATSPVARFLRTHLPGTRILTALHNALRDAPAPIRAAGLKADAPWTTLGTAIDYRIRMWLGATIHPAVMTASAILASYGDLPHATPGHAAKFEPHVHAARAADLLQAVLASYPHYTHPLPFEQQDNAARAAIVAARYDAITRTHGYPGAAAAIGHFTELRLGPHPAEAMARLFADVPMPQANDIRLQFEAATRTLHRFTGTSVTFAPVFSAPDHIGHAEGDFIADGVLVDCKAVLAPNVPRAQALRWFHQLAGYLLMDHDDVYRIHSVGLYLSRQATLVTWPVPEFLRLMGTHAPVEHLRSRFRTALLP